MSDPVSDCSNPLSDFELVTISLSSSRLGGSFADGCGRLRATGIGAFFDEEVNRYLGLSSELGQVVYHFAIGYPVADPRLEA